MAKAARRAAVVKGITLAAAGAGAGMGAAGAAARLLSEFPIFDLYLQDEKTPNYFIVSVALVSSLFRWKSLHE
jgi:hypothetical protein